MARDQSVAVVNGEIHNRSACIIRRPRLEGHSKRSCLPTRWVQKSGAIISYESAIALDFCQDLLNVARRETETLRRRINELESEITTLRSHSPGTGMDKSPNQAPSTSRNRASRITATEGEQLPQSETGRNQSSHSTANQNDVVIQDSGRGTASDSVSAIGNQNHQGDNESYFYGESSAVSLMQEVHEIVSPPSKDGESTTNSKYSRVESLVFSAVDPQPRRIETIRNLPSNYVSARCQMSDFDLPPRSLADHLVVCYFSRVHLLYPFLHRPTFQASYKRFWDMETSGDASDGDGRLSDLQDAGFGNKVDSSPQSQVFYCGINAIFALSCQFSDLPISKIGEAAKTYLERAMGLLLQVELLDTPTVSLVQVLLLLGLHLQSTSLSDRCWNVIGMACRMAQGLGLHIADGEVCGDGNGRSGLEVEIRRRVWYTCVMLDL